MGDAEVYIRADQGKLTNKGVINRASTNSLVDGSGATCSELREIVRVDQSTIEVEKKIEDQVENSISSFWPSRPLRAGARTTRRGSRLRTGTPSLATARASRSYGCSR